MLYTRADFTILLLLVAENVSISKYVTALIDDLHLRRRSSEKCVSASSK